MNKQAEERMAAKLANTIAMLCMRNNHLETKFSAYAARKAPKRYPL